MQVVGGGLNGQEVLLQRQIQGRGLGARPRPLSLFLDQTEKQTKPPYLKICRSGSGAHRSRGKSMAPASLSAGLTMIKLDKNFDTMESLS